MRQPPLIATWCLQRFGCSPDNEAVLGDLAEQYQCGRSRFWYARQVFVAVLVGFSQEILKEKFLTARCITAGVVLAILLSTLLERLVVADSPSSRFPPLFWLLGPAACVGSVHLTNCMASLHRSYARAFVLLYVLSFSSVLYLSWLASLSRFPEAHLRQIILGGIANYVWIVSALASSGFWNPSGRRVFGRNLQ